MNLLQRNSCSQSYSSQLQGFTQKLSGDGSMWLHSYVGLNAGDIYLSNHVLVNERPVEAGGSKENKELSKYARKIEYLELKNNYQY